MSLMSRTTTIAVLGLLLSLGACKSGVEKADAYEAQYDRMMSVQAYPAAMSAIQKAVSYDDSSARRYLKMAELQMQMGRPAAAANSFQAALDLEPDNIEALENMSILAVRSGQLDAAKRFIDPLLALSASDPAGLLASGAIAVSQRRFKDALPLSDQIVTALPDRADGYVLKARALDGLGRTREAIDLLEKRAAVADDPRDFLFQVMAFYRRIGDMRGIRATAIKMMPLFPGDPRYALEAARAYAASGDQGKVHEIIDGLLHQFAHNADVLVAIGDFWRDTLPLPRAQAQIVKLAANAPPRVQSALADQLIGMGDPHDALGLLASLAPANVTSGNIDSQTHYARALLATGQTAQAKAKVDAVLAFDRGNAEALVVRARLKLMAKDYRGAFTDAQLVTNDDDQNEEAALLVAQVYAAQGNQVLAAGAFGNLRQQFPESTNALRAEIDWLISQKRTDEAAQRAVSFSRTHPRSGPATQIARTTCTKTHAPACGFQVPSVAKMLAL
jgi:tetratricopeptide (TPR) repeat protein